MIWGIRAFRVYLRILEESSTNRGTFETHHTGADCENLIALGSEQSGWPPVPRRDFSPAVCIAHLARLRNRINPGSGCRRVGIVNTRLCLGGDPPSQHCGGWAAIQEHGNSVGFALIRGYLKAQWGLVHGAAHHVIYI